MQKARRADAIANESKVRQAADVVFGRRGSRITMDDVAREAEVSSGTIYNVFGSRPGMLDALAIGHFDRCADLLERHADTARSAADVLAEGIDPLLLGATATCWFGEFSSDGPELARERLRAALAHVLVRGADTGRLRHDVGVDDVMFMYLAVFLALPPYSDGMRDRAGLASSIILRGILM